MEAQMVQYSVPLPDGLYRLCLPVKHIQEVQSWNRYFYDFQVSFVDGLHSGLLSYMIVKYIMVVRNWQCYEKDTRVKRSKNLLTPTS